MLESTALPLPVLTSLGRLAWFAMNLEDWTNAACECVLGEFRSRVQIGTHIDSAVAKLRNLDQTGPLSDAISWMLEAKSSLQLRNQVLHSIPIQTVHYPSSEALSEPGLVYVHKQPTGGQRPAPTYTALNEKALGEISDLIEITLSGFRSAYFAISDAVRPAVLPAAPRARS